MRTGRRPLALVAMIAFTACGTNAQVHTSRVDPIGASVPPSDPTDTSAPAGTNGPADTTEPGNTSAPGNDTLNWAPCTDSSAVDPSLECATLKVPLDYDNPSGDSLLMALIKYPASGDRTGAVLFNPGGPGGSGFDPIGFSGSAIAQGLGISTLDLIGFDPRGVDRSGGLHCVSDQFEDQHLYVDDTPDTPEEQALKDEADTGFVDGCKQKYGDTLRFYSTANTARDMDALRAALGDDQISVLGLSYGTYLGATYATMFPDRVRAMVLDSVVEPNGDTVQQAFETQLVGFEGAFNNWAAWCQSDTTCEFNAADVGARWDALRQKLDDTSITGSDGRVANNATMETATTAALYSKSDWPVLGQALNKAEAGDPAGIFALADSYNGRDDKGTFTTLFQSFPIISCASGIGSPLPDDPEALAATLRTEAPRFAKDTTAADVTSEAERCSKLVGDVKPDKISYTGDGPIVLVGGANDPATPIRWAKKMVGELGPNARLVTFTGEGHGQLLVSNCVTDIEGSLLADLKLPGADTVCDPNPVIPKPDWWDALPVPTGMSDVASLPAVAAALGAEPTQVFSELRTTALSAKDAVAAYTKAFGDAGLDEFDAPPLFPSSDTAQGVYSDGQNRTMAVIALGPKSFDDEALQSAKVDVPPDTTVVWIIAIGN
ncbi:MAG: alpha/beta fold hydrolase [Ilumatobacteraceae bacterium]|nr:alpha/beta fold hydrolase [Ilumatobacteraceae bacterium]